MVGLIRRQLGACAVVSLLAVGVAAGLIPGHASADSGTGTISGYITDMSGNPLSGVEVDLEPAVSAFSVDEAVTDATGHYSMTDPDGVYFLDVLGSDASNAAGVPYLDVYYGATAGAPNSQDFSSATPITITSGGTVPVSVQTTTGGEISGNVTDASTHEALTDGFVSVVDSSGRGVPDEADLPVSATGSYTVTGLLTGTYYLDFTGDEGHQEWTTTGATPSDVADASGWYGPSVPADTWQSSTGIAVTAGSVTPSSASIALPTATTVSGTVTGNGGQLGDAIVNLEDSAGNVVAFQSSDDSGTPTEGDYEFYGVLPGSYKVRFATQFDDDGTTDDPGGNLAFQYWNNDSTFASSQSITPSATAPATGINANLVPGGEISGTVTDASSGRGLSDVDVELLDASGDLLASAVSRHDGTYDVDGVPSGSYYLEFTFPSDTDGGEVPAADAYQPQYYGDKQVLTGSTPVSVSAGSTTPDIDAAMEPITTAGQTTTVNTTVTAPIPTVAGTPPTITGTAKVGQTLTAGVSGWSAGTSYSYQWYAGAQPISGATTSTLTLTAAQYGQAITVQVTGKLPGDNWTQQTSAATQSVAAGTLKTAVPKISGTARVGDRLLVTSGAWTAGTKFSYQWSADGQRIAGATARTLKLKAAEKGKKVTVAVTGKCTGYLTATKTSKATAKVA